MKYKVLLKSGVVCGVIIVACSAAFGSGRIINYDNDPDLAVALEHDREMNGSDLEKADRSVAEKHYLAYLERCDESFQRAKVFYQLGVMHTTARNSLKGEAIDREKARVYFMAVLEEEPDRIGRATVRARTQYASVAGEREDRIRARMDVYEWALGVDEAGVRRLWLPDRPGAAAPSDDEAASMASYVEAIRMALVFKMMDGAVGSPHGSVLLGEIIRRFPGTRAEELARIALKKPNPHAVESYATELLEKLAEEALENPHVTTEIVSEAAEAAELDPPEPREVSRAPVEEAAAPRRIPIWALATAGALIVAVTVIVSAVRRKGRSR